MGKSGNALISLYVLWKWNPEKKIFFTSPLILFVSTFWYFFRFVIGALCKRIENALKAMYFLAKHISLVINHSCLYFLIGIYTLYFISIYVLCIVQRQEWSLFSLVMILIADFENPWTRSSHIWHCPLS